MPYTFPGHSSLYLFTFFTPTDMPISFEDNLVNSRTFLACMACLLFWESITSMPKETELIWRQRKWGLVKVRPLLAQAR